MRPSCRVQRERALARYYANPQICKACATILEVPDGVKASEVRRKSFCNRQCSTRFNNRKSPKRAATLTFICIACDGKFPRPRSNAGALYNRKVCDDCLSGYNSAPVIVPHLTKAELYERTSNWQSANSTIRQWARRVFQRSGRPQACQVCGYTKHIHVAHARAVSDFPDEAKISEVNAINNLVALCPTHHWEFDNTADAP